MVCQFGLLKGACCRPLEPYGNGWLWIGCHILAFVGAFSNILLAVVYDAKEGFEGHYVRTSWKVKLLKTSSTDVLSYTQPYLLRLLHHCFFTIATRGAEELGGPERCWN